MLSFIPSIGNLLNFSSLFSNLFNGITTANERHREWGNRSAYDMASTHPVTSLGSAGLGKVHPVLGWLSKGVATGVATGAATANPYSGVGAGVMSLASGFPDMINETSARSAQKKQRQIALERERRERKREEAIDQLLEKLNNFQPIATNNREFTVERQNENKQIVREVQRGAQGANPVNTYNNLQIQRADSFSIFATPPIARHRTQARAVGRDGYRRGGGVASAFFSTF